MSPNQKLPSAKNIFHIWPPGSGRIVKEPSKEFQESIIQDKIWRKFDAAMEALGLGLRNRFAQFEKNESVAGSLHGDEVEIDSDELKNSQVAKKSTSGGRSSSLTPDNSAGSDLGANEMSQQTRYNLRLRKVTRKCTK